MNQITAQLLALNAEFCVSQNPLKVTFSPLGLDAVGLNNLRVLAKQLGMLDTVVETIG